MIYTTCLMVYVGLSYRKTQTNQVALALGLVVFCISVTVYYHYLQDPTFHQTVYAALTFFIVFKSIYDMEYTLRPSLRMTRESDRVWKEHYCLPVPTKEQQKYENERDLSILKNMWILVAFGVSIFLGAFAIWGLDRVACTQLRVARRKIGLPWGIFLEGHAWWRKCPSKHISVHYHCLHSRLGQLQLLKSVAGLTKSCPSFNPGEDLHCLLPTRRVFLAN